LPMKSWASRGGEFIGAIRNNLPGIDGFLDGLPAQLKGVSGRSPTAVTQAVKDAAINAKNAGFTGVEVFIKAPRVGAEAVLNGPIKNIILQQPSLSAINVFTADGVVRIIR